MAAMPRSDPHIDITAEFAVESGDAVELRARHLQRRDFAGLGACRELGEFKVVQIADHGIHSPARSSIRRLRSGGDQSPPKHQYKHYTGFYCCQPVNVLYWC